jgi:hypothetical protein
MEQRRGTWNRAYRVASSGTIAMALAQREGGEGGGRGGAVESRAANGPASSQIATASAAMDGT